MVNAATRLSIDPSHNNSTGSSRASVRSSLTMEQQPVAMVVQPQVVQPQIVQPGQVVIQQAPPQPYGPGEKYCGPVTCCLALLTVLVFWPAALCIPCCPCDERPRPPPGQTYHPHPAPAMVQYGADVANK
jgi:hypothetical protein